MKRLKMKVARLDGLSSSEIETIFADFSEWNDILKDMTITDSAE